MLVKNSGQNINWDKRVLKSQLGFIYLKIQFKNFYVNELSNAKKS